MDGIGKIPNNPPDLVATRKPSVPIEQQQQQKQMGNVKVDTPQSPQPQQIQSPSESLNSDGQSQRGLIASPPTRANNIYEDQNQNRVKGELKIEIPIPTNLHLNGIVDCEKIPPIGHTIINPNPASGVHYGPEDFVYENTAKFIPSSSKDLELMKNIRKVYVSRCDNDNLCSYKVTDETGNAVFETVQGETDGSIWSRYFRQQQKIICIQDKQQHGILKLEFGRSRTVSCCQTLRFAAMTAHFKSKSEEPLCIIFKDRGCCIYSCCSSDVTYETVPQLDTVHPFTVRTKRQWKNRAEFMVKHSDGSILAFIDKEKKFYTLTMGENLKPTMKACLIGFVITMDIMDREDAGKFNCYLRPSTYVTILFLLMLFFMIGAFLFHFITAMVLAWPRTDRMGSSCTDGVHTDHFDPFMPPSNYTHSAEVNATVAQDI